MSSRNRRGSARRRWACFPGSPGRVSAGWPWCRRWSSRLRTKGLDVIVEAGAGLGALIPDAAYKEAGRQIGDAWSADVVVKVAPPTDAEIARLGRDDADRFPRAAQRRQPSGRSRGRCGGVRRRGHPADLPRPGHGRTVVPGQCGRLQGRPARGASNPRGSSRCSPPRRARSSPPRRWCSVWASPACRHSRPPSGWARRTTGYDVRPEVADQVRSLGAQWLDLGIDAAGEGGYARELSDDERAAAEAAEDAI